MSTLTLYVNGQQLYQKEIFFPEPAKRLDRHGKIDWRKAHIDGEVEKIKVMFYRQILKYDWQIIMNTKSKMK